MSAFFTLIMDHRLQEFEITDNCELVVLDYDLAWDDMLVAMGGQASEVKKVFDAWQVDPTEMLFHMVLRFGGQNQLLRLGLDYAEHAIESLIWAFESEKYGEYKQFVLHCLSSVRGFLEGDIHGHEASTLDQRFEDYQNDEVRWRLFGAGRENAIDVCAMLVRAWLGVHYGEPETLWHAMLHLSDETEEAVMFRGTDYEAHTEVGQAYNAAEHFWHLAHAARVVHALQFDEPWPVLEETP